MDRDESIILPIQPYRKGYVPWNCYAKQTCDTIILEVKKKTSESSAPRPEIHEIMRGLTGIASQSLDFSTGVQSILSTLGLYAGWPLGRLLILDGVTVKGETEFVWQNGETFAQTAPPSFFGTLDNANLSAGEVLIIEDLRASHNPAPSFGGNRSLLLGYIACPIIVHEAGVAVLEFHSVEPMRPGPEKEAVVAHVAMLLGMLIEHERLSSSVRESDRRFRALFEQPYSYVLLVEPDGTLIEANELALQLGGVRAAEVLGKKIWDKAWWKRSDEGRQALRSAIGRVASGEVQHFKSSIQEADGRTLHYETMIKPLSNNKGEVTVILLEGRDVSQVNQSLDDLRQIQATLEEAQRIAQLGNWEYRLLDNRATWSETLYLILGLDRATAQASDEELLKRIHPDDVELVREAFSRSIDNREPYEIQFRIVRPDGAIRAVYGAGGPKLNQNNEVSSLTGIIQDISGRHELERSLAAVVERLSGLNAMGQAVSSSLDTDSISRYVLSTARALLEADDIILFMHEGNELYVAAIDEQKSQPFVGMRMPENMGIAGDVWGTGRAIIWVSGDKTRTRRLPQLQDMLGYEPGTILAVPVRWQDEMMGVLEAADVEENAFTQDDIRTLEAVATWTAIAIGNANQHRLLQRRLQESEAIATVSRELSGTLEPQAILELIVQTAHSIVPSSDWAAIHLLRGRPERLEPAAVAGTDEDLSHYIIELGEGIAGHVLLEGRVINAGDVRNDPRSSRFAKMFGLRSLLVAPVKSPRRELGTISLHSMNLDAFSDEDEKLLSILATQAALAIENADLFDSQRRARMVAEMQRERLRVLTDRLVSTQEDERMRISRELHDEAGQALTSLKISLDLARARLPDEQADLRKTLGDLGALAGETMDTLRMLAHDLRPPGLDAFGLNVALEGLCYDFAKRTLLSVEYKGTELIGLRTTVALSLYRLVQEALTNIAKHAEALSVTVNLTHADQALYLTIIDDGKGFSMDSNGQQHNGIGLVSMQERTDMLGGTLEIDTAPGRGTRLIARIPVELEVQDSDYAGMSS